MNVNLKSNAIRITIGAPGKDAEKAATLFRSGGMGTWLGIVGSKHADRIWPIFEQLAKDYPGTIYGKYARMALVLRHAEDARTQQVKMEPRTWGVLATELSQAISLFEAGHPLRSRALYCLAGVQRAAEVAGNPEETITQLLSETSDGQMTRMGRELLNDMVRRQRDRGGGGNGMPRNHP